MSYYKLFTDEDLDVIYESTYMKGFDEYYTLSAYSDNSLQNIAIMMKIKYALYLADLLQEPSMIGNMKYVTDNKEQWIKTFTDLAKCNYTPRQYKGK